MARYRAVAIMLVVIVLWAVALSPWAPLTLRPLLGSLISPHDQAWQVALLAPVAVVGCWIVLLTSRRTIAVLNDERSFFRRLASGVIALAISCPVLVLLGAAGFASVLFVGGRVGQDATDSAIVMAWVEYLRGWPRDIVEAYAILPTREGDNVGMATVGLFTRTASNLSAAGLLVGVAFGGKREG